MTTLCIDGYNLSLPRGTGIATYGRSLLQGGCGLGFRTEILFGPAAPRSKINVVNEANLVSAESAPTRSLFEKARRRVERRFGTGGTSVWPVEISGDVLWPESRGGPPAAAGLWAGENIFHRAARNFRDHGRSFSVSFDTCQGRPRPDIMHWTTAMSLHAKGIPNIYTIHDLIPLKAPHTTISDRAAFMALHALVARRADHIAVVSEATRRDVVRLLRVPEDRVTTTYQTLSVPDLHLRRSELDVSRYLESAFNLEWKQYFIHFGAIEPKKNLGRLVEAYLASGSRRPLVIVGGRGWLQDDETALITQVIHGGGPAVDRIRVHEYLTQSSLISLVRGARALLFPSIDEGFGLPVLEAMALGTAVLTSTAGALPEVSGEAALTVDAEDVVSIQRGVQALDVDDALVEHLIDKGASQAKVFSADAYEDRLRGLYASFL